MKQVIEIIARINTTLTELEPLEDKAYELQRQHRKLQRELDTALQNIDNESKTSS